jgi:predicted TPR repeat methyltransferase
LADALEKLGDSRSAGAEFAKVLEFRPQDTAVLMRLGICQQKCGSHDEAVGTFSRVLELKPGDKTAQAHLDRSLETRLEHKG